MKGHNPSGPVRKLSRAALAFRAFHAGIALVMLLSLSYVWWCALSGRRGPSVTRGRGVADRRRRARRRQPRRLPAGRVARASRGPRPFVRAGAVAPRGEAGGAGARRDHRGRACPTGCTWSTRRPLGGKENERGHSRRFWRYRRTSPLHTSFPWKVGRRGSFAGCRGGPGPGRWAKGANRGKEAVCGAFGGDGGRTPPAAPGVALGGHRRGGARTIAGRRDRERV